MWVPTKQFSFLILSLETAQASIRSRHNKHSPLFSVTLQSTFRRLLGWRALLGHQETFYSIIG
ncbi:hypothetical protein I79_004251 [Cricetulus griseus]|uniref:Uncharacterized protein n=1 Tax=Cricetulus griseus TaxID=10029 RepID=G3H281_CRIGR|nr:hypothetical protein I79_004251 [Cricetulus griseus]